jgi:predicted CoA-binding protein
MQTAADGFLSSFFDAQGVAVIGISLNPAKLGYGIAQNLVLCGYQGGDLFCQFEGGHAG